MKKTTLFIFFFALLLCKSVVLAQRIGFSSETWKVIRTEHFDVVFSAQQQDLGLYYANTAESAYQNLSTVFINRPEKIILIVNDTTDISNGYATRIPYPHVMAYTVQIGDHESLSEAGEWPRELITHELTHIMQFEPALGVYSYIRPIFGSIVAPNLLMPLWWKEGMAVEMETQFSPQGRSRSKYQDASIRAFVLDKKLFDYTLPQANEVLPSWPYGSRPYLFGSLFWSQLVKDTNTAGVNTIVSRQGERFPYTLEEPMRELVDHTYETEYSKALYEANANAHEQIDKLNTLPTSTFKNIEQKGQTTFAPRWSDKFQLLAFIERIDGETYLKIKNSNLEYLKLKKLPDGSIGSLDFHPNEKKILYSKVDRVNSKYQFSDLYIYDIEKDKSEQITFSERARDASFSEDGNKIIFISTFNGGTQIKTLDLQTNKIELLQDSGISNRYQSPLFWNEHTVFVSKNDIDGTQSLFQIDLATKQESKVNLNYKRMRFLRKKENSLYFTSSENGVFNIYVTTDLKTAVAVTHATTGLWSYDIDLQNNKIWATQMTSEGFHIAEANLSKQTKTLPVIENNFEKRYTFIDNKRPVTKYSSEEYSASDYLLPTYWIPYIASSSSSKGLYLQAQTSGQDPLQVHQYALSANYETDIEKGGFVGSYTNSAFAVPFQIGTAVTNQAFGDVNNTVETKTAYLGLLPDVFWINKKLLFQIGSQYQETTYLDTTTKHWGPYLQFSYLDYSQSIFQISPEDGWGGLVRYENNNNIQDSRDYNKIEGTLLGYFSKWLPKHHALMGRLSGLKIFESMPSRFGTSSNSSFYASDSLIPQFVLRGYAPYQFYGRTLWNFNTEYRFPLATIERGSGTDAYFLKRLSGAVLVDGLGVDGWSVTKDKVYLLRTSNESFWSSGLELRLETTVGYVLPLNFVLGVYVPHSPLYSSSVQTGISLQIGGF